MSKADGSSTTLLREESFQQATQSERDPTTTVITQETGRLKDRTRGRKMNGQFLTDERTIQVLVEKASVRHSKLICHKEAKKATDKSE